MKGLWDFVSPNLIAFVANVAAGVTAIVVRNYSDASPGVVAGLDAATAIPISLFVIHGIRHLSREAGILYASLLAKIGPADAVRDFGTAEYFEGSAKLIQRVVGLGMVLPIIGCGLVAGSEDSKKSTVALLAASQIINGFGFGGLTILGVRNTGLR